MLSLSADSCIVCSASAQRCCACSRGALQLACQACCSCVRLGMAVWWLLPYVLQTRLGSQLVGCWLESC